MGYVLEVVQFITKEGGEDGWRVLGSKLKHIGYMRAKFKTRKDACSYYNRHNPGMRELNAHNTYRSDWHPDTHLMYIVRKNQGIVQTIPPFSKEDEPTDDGSSRRYKWLK